MSLLSNPREPQKAPLLCYVTDRKTLSVREPSNAIPALLGRIQQIASAGVDWVQLREKDLSAKEFASVTRQTLQSCAPSPDSQQPAVRIIVNDRVDLALAEGAAGVHLAENSLPVEQVRRLLRECPVARPLKDNFLIGASCHSLEGAQAAAVSGADYIFFGPIFSTPSKAHHGAPQGLDRLLQVCRSISIPVLAIGGITVENLRSCLEAGAAGIAAIRLFQDSADPTHLINLLRQLAGPSTQVRPSP